MFGPSAPLGINPFSWLPQGGQQAPPIHPPMLGGPQLQNPNNPGPNPPPSGGAPQSGLPNPGDSPLATLNRPMAPPMLGQPAGQPGGLGLINRFSSPGGLQSLFGR